ncbi:hypothetical protein MN0502_04400 [Arthrobacter sp. MN05-02]|nr:hypothetical protein MN0502_04400 [Arthrobacter sp. MN05-02]
MTSLLGSKRWMSAVTAVGMIAVVSGCASSGAEDAGVTATSSPSASSSAASSASSSPSATPESSPESTTPATSAPTAATESATPSPSPSASESTPAAAGGCTAAQLSGAVEDQVGGAAAGSVYRTIVLTNTSDQECVVEGFPGVSFVDASGTQIGAAADRDGSATTPVVLAPGASATATLQQTNAQNYGDGCGITPAAGVRVYPPGATDSLVLSQEIPACSASSIVLMTVGTLQPAT